MRAERGAPADDSAAYWRKRALALQAQVDTLLRRNEQLETLCAAQQSEIADLKATATAQAAEIVRLRCENRDLREKVAHLESVVARFDERLHSLLRQTFGQRSERLTLDQGYIPEIAQQLIDEFGLDDADAAVVRGEAPPEWAGLTIAGAPDEAAVAKVDAVPDETASSAAPATTSAPRRRRPEQAGGRHPLPEHLERIEETYQPPEDHPSFANAATVEQVGTRTIERLDVPELNLIVRAITCPVVRVTAANGSSWQETIAPPAVIDGGQVSDRFIICSVVEKVADHLPAYRQEQRAARLDLTIPRSKLCRWHIALGTFLAGIADALLDELICEPVLGIDDSVHRLLTGQGRCAQGRAWAVTGEAGVWYQITETREGRWIADALANYSGAVMGDGYRGHLRLLVRDDITPLFCWAHVRRKFFEAADAKRRTTMLEMIGQLYEIERDIAAQPPDRRDPLTRRRRGKPVLDQIKILIDAWYDDPVVLPKSGIGIAVRYTLRLWHGLVRYLDIPHAAIDNNATERHMRPIAMHRKNSLFSASRAGAQAYAVLLSLIESAKQLGIEPVAYLRDCCENLHHRRLSPAELTPKRYAARTAAEVKEAS